MPDLLQRDLSFQLFEVLKAQRLSAHGHFADFSRETIEAVLETTAKIADGYFAPFYQQGDHDEPRFADGCATVLPAVGDAWNAVAEAGLLAAHHDHELGGMQMPQVVQSACMATLFAANVAFAAYPFLTMGAANLIRAFGSPELKALFLPPMLDGRFAGTMALTEPGQGSALADIRTLAHPTADGSFRLSGNKMFISGGDQDFTENIIHMVLARIPGSPDGVKGISLFLCPKYRLTADGKIGAFNDVALAGLLHKMGYRQTTSTVLNFGEKDDCVAFLVGQPNRGLDYMFQMMNEARINVALGAAALGLRGFEVSLEYARERPQGRLPSMRDPSSAQVPIIAHSDVRRMLLAQKSYSEGALALCLYASLLVDEHKAHSDPEARDEAGLLLDFLTPIVKTFSSEYCVRANDLAIQTLGGAGYIREYPVEQFYRDNRLNPIHEGTTGIQALDLLGRKVRMRDGAALSIFLSRLHATAVIAASKEPLRAMASSLADACAELEDITSSLLSLVGDDPDLGLANSTQYLDLASRVTVAWIWLQQAITANSLIEDPDTPAARHDHLHGKIQAATYFFEWELPQIAPLGALLRGANRTCFDMRSEWF